MPVLNSLNDVKNAVSALSNTVKQAVAAPGTQINEIVTSAKQKAVSSTAGLLDSVQARLAISGLVTGTTGKKTPDIGFGKSVEQDWRVRISLADSSAASRLFYQTASVYGNILHPLQATNGVVFPYTPQIALSYVANYESLNPIHSNYAYYFYRGSEVRQITVSGDFTVQNKEEGRYYLAAMHFFRTLTKMFYANGRFAGNPPPLVYLDGYGEHVLKKVPCVVTAFLHTMPDGVDYMPVGFSSGSFTDVDGAVEDSKNTTWVPMFSTLQVDLQPVVSREEVGKFNLEDYATGTMLNTSIGGKFL